MKVAVLIPAYNPSQQLVTLVQELSCCEFLSIVIVNDGSKSTCNHFFKKVASISKTKILHHAVNLGKGAALKTGLNYIYCRFPDLIGAVTIDADGQHLVEDALNVARDLQDNPDALITGVRVFAKGVPLRSMFGNILTKKLFRFLVGQKLNDTQCGLRGIPREFIPKLLKIESTGYEFELDMLLACKYSNRRVVEREISTIYIADNQSSHFNPLLDSMKIYYVLFRFSFTSLLTALIDYTVFILVFSLCSSIAVSQIAARFLALGFNYSAVKQIVFYSDQEHKKTFPKYLALVIVSGSVSFMLINILVTHTAINVIMAKVLSELLIFLVNFAIQRDFIFTRQVRKETATDWDRYYEKTYFWTGFFRKITEGCLHDLIKIYVTPEVKKPDLAEIGGANSCFLAGIHRSIPFRQYHIFDNNQLGLDKLNQRIDVNDDVYLHNVDVLKLEARGLSSDLVFSVGLIEHFPPEDTRKAIQAHFKLVKPGGIVIMSFPTPTLLYRFSRFLSEWLGLWMFHDERPLDREEVMSTVKDCGTVVYEKIIWPIFFTQRIMVIRAGDDSGGTIART